MEERLPCPTCRTPVELDGELCQQCGASLLVDLVLASPVADGRTRYRLARSLGQLPGAPPVPALQSGLAAAPPVVARGVTRAFAHSALPLLGESGLRGSIEKHVERRSGGGPSARSVMIGAAATVILVLAFIGWQKVASRLGPQDFRLTDKDVPLEAGAPAGARKPASIAPRELVQRALRSTASMRCRDSVGSGVFVAPDLVLTNAHVLCPAGEAIQVGLSDERTFSGDVARRDDALDLALVKVAVAGASVTPLPLGDVGDVAVGDNVTIVGSPVGLDFSVQEGTLSSLQRSSNGVAYLQLDAKVSPGNSGGPVVDAQGRVVGIVSMKVTGQGVEGIGLAIPINYVYGPALAYVAPPSPGAASSSQFQQMVARAQKGTTETGLQEARSEEPEPEEAVDDRPLLVSGHVDQYQNLVVRVVRITDFPPHYEEIAVTVSSGLDTFCTIKGDISTWKQADASLAASEMSPTAAVALAKIAQGHTIYVGESPLRWDLCDRTKMRSGIVIELQGASPLANRLKVR
jgi:serine protease Do